MDAHYYNGSDDREFGPAPDEGDCESCGVDSDTPCLLDCQCQYCLAAARRLAATYEVV